jgi:hypothetical protein
VPPLHWMVTRDILKKTSPLSHHIKTPTSLEKKMFVTTRDTIHGADTKSTKPTIHIQ